jgi:hypothetical protein
MFLNCNILVPIPTNLLQREVLLVSQPA